MRKDTREHLEQLELACELAKLIRHFFPGLVPLLKKLPDPRNQSYTTYPGAVLLMTRILSSIFYISSMRKTSEEFNSDTVIENVWSLCGEEPAVDELPYWETINRYLKRMDPCGLQEAINSLCRRLLRSRAFEDMRIRGKYWQVVQHAGGAGWKEPVPHPPERDGGRVPGKLLLCPGSEAGAASKDHRKLPDGIRGERGQERDGKAGL